MGAEGDVRVCREGPLCCQKLGCAPHSAAHWLVTAGGVLTPYLLADGGGQYQQKVSGRTDPEKDSHSPFYRWDTGLESGSDLPKTPGNDVLFPPLRSEDGVLRNTWGLGVDHRPWVGRNVTHHPREREFHRNLLGVREKESVLRTVTFSEDENICWGRGWAQLDSDLPVHPKQIVHSWLSGCHPRGRGLWILGQLHAVESSPPPTTPRSQSSAFDLI